LKKLLTNRKLIYILIIAAIVRFYIAFCTGLPWISIDSVNYINQAKVLLSGGYTYYFPNGYPVIIALFILISPIVPLKIGLIIFNIFISLFSLVLVYLIAEKYFKENTFYPLLIITLLAFYPNQINYVRFILTEVPATFFLILSLYLFTINKNRVSAVSAGVAATIRTTLLPVAFLFSIYLFYCKRFKEGILFLFFSIIPISVFLIYGYLKTGNFTLYIDVPKVFYISLGLEKVPGDFWTGISIYLRYLIEHPFNFVIHRIVSLWDLWGFLPASTNGLRATLFFKILIALRFPLLLFAIYGFLKSKKNYMTIFLIIPFMTITFIHAIIITSANENFISNPRYLFPVEPFMIILAVSGIQSLMKNKNKFLQTKS